MSSEEFWVKIQRKTFARWVDSVVSPQGLSCSDNLEDEMKDGVILHSVLTGCSGQVLPKITPKPRVLIQKIENVTKCFKWMQQTGIKLVATGAEDIYNGNTKYVLGVIWTLILYYQLDSTEDEEELGMSMRSALLEWCNNVLQAQGITLRNFTDNWKDGKAFSGLINVLQPNTIPHQEYPPEKAETNLTHAFNTANELFKFPKLLEASDLIQYQDELSIITYVSYFRAYLSKFAAFAPNTYAEGPGLTEALTGKPAVFTVFAVDQNGEKVTRGGAFIRMSLRDTNTNKECGKFVVKDHLDGTYSCTYETEKFGTKGNFQLHVKVGSQPIKDSPFSPEVIPGEADPSKCVAFGPGVEFAKAGEETQFTVQAKDLKGDSLTKGGTTITASLTGPGGATVPVTVVDNNNGTYTCTYQTQNADKMLLNVSAKTQAFGTGPISGSPYTVKVGPGLASATNTTAAGEGTKSATAGERAQLTVTTRDRFGNTVLEGGAPIGGELVFRDSSGTVSTPIETLDNGDGTYTLTYVPTKAGNLDLIVKIGDTPISGAPLSVKVSPGATSPNNTKVTLKPHAVSGLPGATITTMDSLGNTCLTGGDTVKAECTPQTPLSAFGKDNGDGTYGVVYPPEARGIFRVTVRVNGKVVPKGPWEVEVRGNALKEEEREKVKKWMPKGCKVVERLLEKATESEREAVLAELGRVKK